MSLDTYGQCVQALLREAHGQAPSTHPTLGVGVVGCSPGTLAMQAGPESFSWAPAAQAWLLTLP